MEAVRLDVPAFVFAFSVTAVVGFAVGLLPALRAIGTAGFDASCAREPVSFTARALPCRFQRWYTIWAQVPETWSAHPTGNAGRDLSEGQTPHVAGIQREAGHRSALVPAEVQLALTPTKVIVRVGDQVHSIPTQLQPKVALSDLKGIEEVELVAVEVTGKGFQLLGR